jgi:hypothetical protein
MRSVGFRTITAKNKFLNGGFASYNAVMVLAIALQVIYRQVDFTVEVFMFANDQFEGKLSVDEACNESTHNIHQFVARENARGIPSLVVNTWQKEKRDWITSHHFVDSQRETSAEYRIRAKSQKLGARGGQLAGTTTVAGYKSYDAFSLIGIHLQTFEPYQEEKPRAKKSFFLALIGNVLTDWPDRYSVKENLVVFMSPFSPQKTQSVLAKVSLPRNNPIFCCEQSESGAQERIGSQYITFPTPGRYKKFKMGTRNGEWFTKDLKEGIVPVSDR